MDSGLVINLSIIIGGLIPAFIGAYIGERRGIKAGGRKFVAKCDVAKTLLKYGCILGCVWIAGDMIRDLAHGDPAAMEALCGVLREIKIPHVAHAVLTPILGGGYGIEKSRNKRLVKKRGDNRHEIEQNDAVNTRSGLDEYGNADDD